MDDASVGPKVRLTNRMALRGLLTGRFNESELRALCFDLGIPYEHLSGSDHPSKVMQLIAACERTERISALVALAKVQRPDLVQEIDRMVEAASSLSGPPMITYFIATSASKDEIPARFGITGDEFRQVDDHKSADCVIFDLSNPPEDWLKYVYLKEREARPAFEQIIFVAFEGIAQLQGISVHDILKRSYGQDPEVWETQNALKNMLKRIRTNKWTHTQSFLVGAAVASERQHMA